MGQAAPEHISDARCQLRSEAIGIVVGRISIIERRAVENQIIRRPFRQLLGARIRAADLQPRISVGIEPAVLHDIVAAPYGKALSVASGTGEVQPQNMPVVPAQHNAFRFLVKIDHRPCSVRRHQIFHRAGPAVVILLDFDFGAAYITAILQHDALARLHEIDRRIDIERTLSRSVAAARSVRRHDDIFSGCIFLLRHAEIPDNFVIRG
ncbi:hypothetical protein D3C77_493620 [compost metagenome]